MKTTKSNVLRTTVVSACCALISGFIALQLGTLWFVGALLGAVFGWIAYDPIGFVRGLKRACVAIWENWGIDNLSRDQFSSS